MRLKLISFFVAIMSVFVVAAAPMSVQAADPKPTAPAGCSDRLFTFPAWYRGLQDGDCKLKVPTSSGGISLEKFITVVILNILEILLQLVVYVCVGYIMYGGFKYMTQSDQADGMVRARKTITHAVVGLILSMFSVAIVNFVAASI